MAKWKLILAAIVGLLVLIVILQNTEAVQTRILFVTITMPRAVLLFGTALIGGIVGVLLARKRRGAANNLPGNETKGAGN
jgi:uncharacterized integral membrane protein